MQPINTFDFERDDVTYRAEIYYDGDHGAPWEECDGHGVVSDWERRSKRPGELILNSDGCGNFRFYDWQASIRIARRDRWSCWCNGDELQEAVRRDFEYLRAWCNDEWRYVGVVVFPLTEDGDELRSKEQSVWGIESEDLDYIRETANDLAWEIEQ